MRVVAVDTTGIFGSIALLQDETLLEEIPLHSPEGFSTVLFDSMAQLLRRHAWDVKSVDCFASAAGPGSFTGVRVGLAAVKAIAEGTGCRTAAISNLQALAAAGTGSIRGAVIDARRGEVYAAVYDADSRLVLPEAVVKFAEWIQQLPASVNEIVSPDFTPFRAHFHLSVPITEQRVIAGAVARLARMRLLAGDDGDPAGADANYVRRSDAELNWKDDAQPLTGPLTGSSK